MGKCAGQNAPVLPRGAGASRGAVAHGRGVAVGVLIPTRAGGVVALSRPVGPTRCGVVQFIELLNKRFGMLANVVLPSQFNSVQTRCFIIFEIIICKRTTHHNKQMNEEAHRCP